MPVRRVHVLQVLMCLLIAILGACADGRDPSPAARSLRSSTPLSALVVTETPAPAPTDIPVLVPTSLPVDTPTPEPTATPTPGPTATARRQCEERVAQPITPEQEAVIARWHENLRPRMREFAAYVPEAFEEYTRRFDYYSGAHKPFITLALCDEALALRLLWMPFLAADVGDGLDGDVLAALARLTDPNVGDVDVLLSHPLLEDGITEIDRIVVLLLVLEHERPNAAAMIQRIPWAQEAMREAALSEDDIDTSRSALHHYTLYRLVEMANRSPESLRAFLELPWLTDSFATNENSVHTIAVLASHIAEKSDYGMASVLRMPFLQTLDSDDEDVLDILWETSDAAHNYTDGETPLRQVLSDPALEGGITNENTGDLALADLRVRNPEYSSELEGLPWILDGVSPSEVSGIFALWRLEHLGTDVFQRVVRQQWVADGLTVYESSAIHSFEQLVIGIRNAKEMDGHAWHEEYVLTIPDTGFMRSVGPSEAALMRTLNLLHQDGRMEEWIYLVSTILESDSTQ